ncbi:hypothetical protein GOQ04_01300 [Emticicia sp. ODNR4P]|jgi:hypothetical protein|nr:hypothetical protein [Emticicia sp. ODNR4P]
MNSFSQKIEQIAINQLGKKDFFLLQNEINVIPKLIFPNEPIEGMLKCNSNYKTGLLIATNKRILFIENQTIHGLNVYEFSFSEIDNLSFNPNTEFGNIIIRIKNRVELFENINSEKGYSFSLLINTFLTSQKIDKQFQSSKGSFSGIPKAEKVDLEGIQENKVNTLYKKRVKYAIIFSIVLILVIVKIINYSEYKNDLSTTSIPIEYNAQSNFNAIPPDNKKVLEFIAKVKKNYKVSYDDIEKTYWVYDRSNPVDVTKNGIFVYFGMTESNFWSRIKIQYFGDDWLFIKNYSFKIDNVVVDYQPTATIERDNKSGYVWEILDESPLENVQLDSIWRLLENCNNAKLRFRGDKYHNDKIITKNQLKSLKRMRALYEEAREIYGIKPKQY